jgi:predicted MFS family arabinose efflux permease
MGLTLGILILAMVIVGFVCDRCGMIWVLLLLTVLTVIGIGLFYGAKSELIAITAASCFAFGITIQTMLPPLMAARSVGLKHFGLMVGVVNVFVMLGSRLGTPLSGYIY